MNPAALCFWGVVVAMVIMSAQAAPTGDSEPTDEEPQDITEINEKGGLLGRECDGFTCAFGSDACDFGYKIDDNGCYVCECSPDKQTVMLEGDIEADEQTRHDILSGGENRGASIYRNWPKKIPYVINSRLGSRGRDAIKQAIADFHKYTCLRFHPRSNEGAFFYFTTGSGCSSPVGYHGSPNQIKLAGGCWHKGIVIHEMMHSLGFFHEQSRPDRDQYVTINWSNVPDAKRHNFNKYGYNIIKSGDSPYDYLSVMHYPSTAFGSGKVTIDAKNNYYDRRIGQRSGFSKEDIKQIRKKYGC